MAKRTETEAEPQTKPFQFRARVGKNEWGGMHPDSDPGSIPEFRFRRLINGRRRGGQIVPRGGLSSFTPSALHASDACIIGGGDFQVGTPLRAYIVGDGCPGVSSSVGFSVDWVDQEQSPFMQGGIYYSTATQGVVVAVYGGALYIGQDNRLRKLQFITAAYGTTALSVSGSSQDIPLKTFTGFTKISWMLEFDGRLYIALDGGVGASKIVTWDGLEFVDDLTGIDAITGMVVWNNKLIAGHNGSTNLIRLRVPGAPPGTWSTAAPGAGTVVFFKSGVSYKGKAYWVTGTTADIWSYDGTTLAVARASVAGEVWAGICLHNSLVYYVDSTAANNGRIGVTDGTTFTDNHKTIGGAPNLSLRQVASYRRDLIIGGVRTGGNARLFQSPTDNTAGTYTETNLGTGTLMGDVDQILVA